MSSTTPSSDSTSKNVRVKNEEDAATAGDMEVKDVRFASFLPDNAAAVHLLETVLVSSPPPSLIGDDDAIAYLISLPSLPSNSDDNHNGLMWRIGAGPSPRLIKKGVVGAKVDFLLCPPGNTLGAKKARESIKSVHAILFFHPESGVLSLRNICSKPILYRNGGVNGEDLIIEGGVKGADSCVLFRERNQLRFGDYDFVLEFNLNPKEYAIFRDQRDEILSVHHARPSRHLALVPSPKHSSCLDVRLHHKLSQGSRGPVFCGVHLHTGKPVAVKMLRCDEETSHRIQHELETAALFSDDSDGLLFPTTSWCEHGESPPCRLDKCEAAEDHEDVFLSTPLAEFDFETMPWGQLKSSDRLSYFYQTLSGLGKIHQRGLVHGRIRPRALLISHDYETPASTQAPRSQLPTKAAVSLSVSSENHGAPDRAGCWVAPEVWTSSAEKPYDEKADVWALAASWLPAYVRIPPNIKVDERTYRTMLKTIEDQYKKRKIKSTFRSLLLRMLAWGPEDRPTVAEALVHEAWAPVHEKRVQQEKQLRQEREDRIQRPEAGVKKVRILSPGVED
ncbi:putative serine threonine protein kinase [Podospora australis]|uniref:Serine threonine protein kinase n=1 Tax=Podospora australis TaxID=1536484 RepID=A0AAN6WYB3_9PEZI|nr:putative serine threonine protein kinase [Podospora australis]